MGGWGITNFKIKKSKFRQSIFLRNDLRTILTKFEDNPIETDGGVAFLVIFEKTHKKFTKNHKPQNSKIRLSTFLRNDTRTILTKFEDDPIETEGGVAFLVIFGDF